jgi:hypothetical protein
MKEINFVDLFDWEKESDVHYMSILRHEQDLKEEWQQWDDQRKQRLPAIINVNKPKRQIYEATTNTWQFPGINKKKL